MPEEERKMSQLESYQKFTNKRRINKLHIIAEQIKTNKKFKTESKLQKDLPEFFSPNQTAS